EVEEFELEAAHRHDAELFGALQDALQHLPAIERIRRIAAVLAYHEFAEKEVYVVVPGHLAMRAEVDPRQRIGEALVPAGVCRVVVALVVAIPAEHDVAEAEAAFERRLELVLVQVLAAQHA